MPTATDSQVLETITDYSGLDHGLAGLWFDVRWHNSYNSVLYHNHDRIAAFKCGYVYVPNES